MNLKSRHIVALLNWNTRHIQYSETGMNTSLVLSNSLETYFIIFFKDAPGFIDLKIGIL